MQITFLIAHYNNEKYFVDCYKSLIAQSQANWKAIILDDYSNQDSFLEVKNIISKDNRFSIYRNEKNKGVGYTKAKLIDLVNTDLCGFLDPDDTIEPSCVEDFIFTFKKNPKTVLAYSQFMKCDKNLKPLGVFANAKQVLNNDPFFFNYPIQIAHFVCFRKDIYDTTIKMNAHLKIAEDQDLYLKMYEKGKVKFIQKILYNYRYHDLGISQNQNKPESYLYFAQVILDTMKRRKIKTIKGKKVPNSFSNPNEIFNLLKYKNTLSFRAINKVKILFQN